MRGEPALQYGGRAGVRERHNQEALCRNTVLRLHVELGLDVLTVSVSLGSILQPEGS